MNIHKNLAWRQNSGQNLANLGKVPEFWHVARILASLGTLPIAREIFKKLPQKALFRYFFEVISKNKTNNTSLLLVPKNLKRVQPSLKIKLKTNFSTNVFLTCSHIIYWIYIKKEHPTLHLLSTCPPSTVGSTKKKLELPNRQIIGGDV